MMRRLGLMDKVMAAGAVEMDNLLFRDFESGEVLMGKSRAQIIKDWGDRWV